MDTQGNFTKTFIEGIPVPESGRVTYKDSKLPGLQLRVSNSGSKVFCLRSNLHGKTVRVTIGGFPKVTVEQARNLAKAKLAELAHGSHPNKLKKANIAKATTLRQALEDYIASHTRLKERSIADYQSTVRLYLSDWLDKPLIKITRDAVEKRHQAIGEKSPTQANRTMRITRAVFEYAHGKYENEDGTPVFLYNPVKRLSHVCAWYKETRRETYIKSDELPLWWQAVDTAEDWLDSPDPRMIRDYLLLILFTGLRRGEAAKLKWEWIDFVQNTLTIPATSTKNGHKHSLPLTDFLVELLSQRCTNEGEFIFPGTGKTGHFVEPKKPIIKIREKSGVDFTLHDLRRTFITIAESLNIRDYTLKRLLNHRSSGDVTDGYIMSDVERLREPMQRITETILTNCNQKNTKAPIL